MSVKPGIDNAKENDNSTLLSLFFRIHMLQPPTAFTEIVGCLRQFHLARTTDELNGLCLLPDECYFSSEILRDQVQHSMVLALWGSSKSKKQQSLENLSKDHGCGG